jgi:hypothetical protein
VGLKLNEEKCDYSKKKIEILGHVIENGIVTIDPKRIETINNIPFPKTKKQLESFLGMINYCCKFIRDLSTLTCSLYGLLKDARNANKNNIEDIVTKIHISDF